mmetsp:Transcript_65423/g.210902  ORF Transcript_65423/g.210902 Transcript_65423/m.210902 type:complete len:205 (-) Transcript_65423:2293-2907(-)
MAGRHSLAGRRELLGPCASAIAGARAPHGGRRLRRRGQVRPPAGLDRRPAAQLGECHGGGQHRVHVAGGMDPQRDAPGERPFQQPSGRGEVQRGALGLRAAPGPRGPPLRRGHGDRRKGRDPLRRAEAARVPRACGLRRARPAAPGRPPQRCGSTGGEEAPGDAPRPPAAEVVRRPLHAPPGGHSARRPGHPAGAGQAGRGRRR